MALNSPLNDNDKLYSLSITYAGSDKEEYHHNLTPEQAEQVLESIRHRGYKLLPMIDCLVGSSILLWAYKEETVC